MAGAGVEGGGWVGVGGGGGGGWDYTLLENKAASPYDS